MDEQSIRQALDNIQVEEVSGSVSSMVEAIEPVSGNFHIILNYQADRGQQIALEAQLKKGLLGAGIDIKQIKFRFTEKGQAPAGQPSGAPAPARELKNVKRIIAVGSGKGGVGKSTVSINLASALAAQGYKVGLLDADIYGPSIGTMAGFDGRTELQITQDRIIPVEKFGLKIISFSMLIDKSKAVVWRGPMLGKALEQFLFDIEWGDLDYLVMDMPPGTGDVQLSLAQLVEVDGFVIVTTPQNVALHDAERAADMLQQVNVPILGVIENMSEFVCPNCGHVTHIFSSRGGSQISETLQVELLGKIPLNQAIMTSGETGIPVTASPQDSDDKVAIQNAFKEIIAKMEKNLEQA